MAVARHSENIEVQDGDQDDPNYENETTVTARTTNVEMSEEGHYESLDLQKKDDAVYENLQTKKKSDRSPCSNSMTNDTLVHHYNTLKSSYDTLTLNYTQINILNDNLNQEKDLLQSEVNQLKTADYSKLNQEKNRLESDNTNLNREKDLLQREVNQLKTQIADRPCPCGWTKFGYSCYYRTPGVTSWQEGREECQNLGADLVVINSREEQVFIRGLRTEAPYWSWIGLNRTQGSWTWVDGTPLTTQYWGSGEPRNDEDRNCAAYYHRTDGRWANNGCSGFRASICETK